MTSVGGVVVVSYASSTLLERNLLLLSWDPRLRVVVVDNYSSDHEREQIRALASEHGWELVPRPNLGFGAGMNAGAERALGLGCDALLLLNPDVTIDRDTAAALLDQARRSPDALVTPALHHPDGRAAFAEGTLDLRIGTTRTRPPLAPGLERWLSGACLAVSGALWDRLGGFAEEYFMYWEDLDLCHRVQVAGGSLVVRDDLVAVHAVGGTQGAGKSALYRHYNCRNRLLFAARHLEPEQARRWIRPSLSYAWQVALRDGRRAIVKRPLRAVYPVVTGTMSGIRLVLRAR